jgi:hypothetical protein
MTDAREPVDPGPTIDLDAVVREIEAEARALRRSGAFPAEFERELAALFTRFAPPAASGDLRALIDAAEEHGLIEPFIPVDSQKPAGRFVKQGFAKALGWYHTWLTQEISQFAGSTIRALRVTADRLESLERRLGDAEEQATTIAALPWASDRAAAAASVATVVAGRAPTLKGRVLVARAGQGELVAALSAQGADAYGIEPDAANRDAAEARAVDLLADDGAAHLEAVRRDALGAVVLQGPDLDAAAAGSRLRLARLAYERVGDGGAIVVVATEPQWWRVNEPVTADLAFAPPWTAPTWEFVLGRLGASDVSIDAIDGAVIVCAVVRHRDDENAREATGSVASDLG